MQDTARNPAIAITSVNANIAPGIDANAPALLSAALDEGTGTFRITFSEIIDASTIDLSKIHIRDTAQSSGGIMLSTVELGITADSDTISFLLTDTNRQSAIALGMPHLDIDSGAVQDIACNGIAQTHDNLIPMMDDARPPEFLSAALDEGTGVLEVSFSEAIDQSQPSSISTSGFRISDSSDTDSISLSGASFATISASTISITLNESQRQSVISLVVPVLDIESSTVRDIVQNNIASSNGNTISLTPDTIAPALGNIVFVDSQTITIDINEDIIVPSSFLFTISPSLGVITETYDITSDIITLSTMIPAMDNTSYVITYPEITDLHNNTLHSGIRSVSTSDVTVPTFSARTMSTTTISITFSEPLTGTTTHNQWMVGDTNVTSVSPTVLTGITTIELTLDSALAIDSIPSVTYTQSNSVQLTDGTNPLETMTVTATDGIISLINHLLRVSDTGIFVIFDRNVKSIANETPSITLTLSSPLATSPTLGTPNIVSIEGSAIFIDGFNSTFLNVGQFDIHIANIADISDNAIDGTQSSLTLVRNIEFEATDITIPNIAIDPLVISTPSGHDTFTLTITPQSDGRYKIPSMITIRVPGSELIIPDDTTYTVSATTADELIVRSDPTRHGITHILAMSIINSDNHIVELLNDQLHTPLALVELGSDSSDATLSKPVSKRLENTAGSDYIYHINTPHTQNTRIVHIITECPDSTVTATNAPTLISDHEYYITDGNDIVI